jgi:haloalkane dehalogenase
MTTAAPTPKNHITIDGSRIAYIETGHGDPIVFLHGNPTSSYMWRNVIPHIAHLGRCLAPDLIGMGDSDKLPDPGPSSYTFAQHRHYLDQWFDQVAATSTVTLVLHDWGAALGFDWARRHPTAVHAIAYFEAIVRPLDWSDLGPARPIFEALRSPAGERMVLDDNFFVETLLPSGVRNPLGADVLAEYRRPFTQPGESRRPTLTWAREIPIDGNPANMAATVSAYSRWMANAPIPKLFINADPGAVLVDAARDHCRQWPNQTEITVIGNHLLTEDSADPIGTHLAAWLTAIAATGQTDEPRTP